MKICQTNLNFQWNYVSLKDSRTALSLNVRINMNKSVFISIYVSPMTQKHFASSKISQNFNSLNEFIPPIFPFSQFLQISINVVFVKTHWKGKSIFHSNNALSLHSGRLSTKVLYISESFYIKGFRFVPSSFHLTSSFEFLLRLTIRKKKYNSFAIRCSRSLKVWLRLSWEIRGAT